MSLLASRSGRTVWDVVLDRTDIVLVGSNPVQGMDVYPRLCVLYCPVQIEVLWQADCNATK
jgi:hypothetical protein